MDDDVKLPELPEAAPVTIGLQGGHGCIEVGRWHSDAAMRAYARSAVLADRAERGELTELLSDCNEIAGWHAQDSDGCGTLARKVIDEIAAIRASQS